MVPFREPITYELVNEPLEPTVVDGYCRCPPRRAWG